MGERTFDGFLSVLDILNNCLRLNICYVLSVLDILDRCCHKKFDGFYLHYLYGTFVGPNICCVISVLVMLENFGSSGRLWGANVRCVFISFTYIRQ